MTYKKATIDGTEIHYSSLFSSAEEFLASLGQEKISENVKFDIAWGVVRAKRDKLVSVTDHTQMPDSPLSDEKKKAWADYRQALRDLPQQYDNPDDVVWPTKPE